MKNYILTFASKKFKNALTIQKIVSEYLGYAHIAFSENHLPSFFKSSMSRLRGYGYWCWKPYLISKTLDVLPENSTFWWVDSAIIPLRKAQNLPQNFSYIYLQKNIYSEPRKWCKPITELMLFDADMFENFLCHGQIPDASVIGFKVCPQTRKLVSDWLELCQVMSNIDDSLDQNIAVSPRFKDHRHDQSLLGFVAYKSKLDFLPSLTQYSEYNPQFYHHRLHCASLKLKIRVLIGYVYWLFISNAKINTKSVKLPKSLLY